MGTTLHTLTPPPGARRRRKRVGRGIGSGRGKTSTHGMKGQLARHNAIPRGFEGGQLPLQRRVPKRGFVNKWRVEAYGLNVGLLEKSFEAGQEVTPEVLRERGLVPKRAHLIKLLGTGELSKALRIRVHRVSETAQAKVAAVGGTLELIEAPVATADPVG